MASSIVHLAITNEIIKRADFSNPDRLRLGAIIPDNGPKEQTHLKVLVLDGTRKTFDIEGFMERFGKLILNDDFYMGYYLHLAQDLYHRDFCFNAKGWDPRADRAVERLHRDYRITNWYIVNKYGLTRDMLVPADLNKEPIMELWDFNSREMTDEVKGQFCQVDYDDTFFFTTDMADEMIGKEVEFCLEELNKIRNGEPGIDSIFWSWPRRQ